MKVCTGARPTLAWACEAGPRTCLLSHYARLASMARISAETPSERRTAPAYRGPRT
jgi:hypothetical protein